MTSLIRICVVSPQAYPVLNPEARGSYGGAEVSLCMLMRALSENPAYDISCIVGDYGQPSEERIGQVRILRCKGFSNRLVHGRAIRRMQSLWAALRRAQADLYLQSNASAETGTVALFCRATGRRFVYRVSSDIAVDGRFRSSAGLRGWWFELGLRWAHERVAQTEGQQALLLERYALSSERIPALAPPCPPTPEMKRTDFLWAGRWHPEKHPETFLALAAKLPDERFLLITQDHPSPSPTLPPNAELHTGIGVEGACEALRRAKALVLTSEYEGFPVMLISAAQCGTPVLSLSLDPGGVIRRHRLGIVADGTEESLEREARRLLDPALWEALSRAGPPYVREHHALERVIPLYDRLFRRLAGMDR